MKQDKYMSTDYENPDTVVRGPEVHQSSASVAAESSAAKVVQMSHEMHEIAGRNGPNHQATTTEFFGPVFGKKK